MQSTIIFSKGRAAARPYRRMAPLRRGDWIGAVLTPLRLELLFFAVILAIANAPLFGGAWRQQLVFFPDSIASGEWWRVGTHPFVHVSWYHLLLDGAAFLMLYAELGHWTTIRRLTAVAASAAGSLAAANLSPNIALVGFCGLSGAAHGLMAISAIEMIQGRSKQGQHAGWLMFSIVILKALIEAVTGKIAFGFLYFGLVGVPIAACHAGGVIGGLLSAIGSRMAMVIRSRLPR
jgi:rhomboid family GlyGly-CTERM serine protease